MKPLSACFESLLDDDDAFYDPENDKKAIEDWIKDNYKVVGKLTIDGLIVNCAGSVAVSNMSTDSLTNGLFKWGKISKNFSCTLCNIKSLEGAPKNVDGDFDCTWCKNLKTLKGAPQKCNFFVVDDCPMLEDLTYIPKQIHELHITDCRNLTSLDEFPNICDTVILADLPKLTSLEVLIE